MWKNQAKAKQQPEAKLLIFEHYSLSSFTLSSKSNLKHSKKFAKNKCVCFNAWDYMIDYNENEDENDK